jgi:PAS domain S-box-containing protein
MKNGNPFNPAQKDAIEKGINDIVLGRIPATSLALSLIFFAYGVLDLFIMPYPAARIASLLATGIGLGYVLIAILVRAGKIASKHANATIAMLAFLALSSCFTTMVLLRDGHLSVNLLLVVFMLSVFFASRFWFGMVVMVVITGWSAFLWWRPATISPHYTAALYSGVLLAVVVHEFVRYAFIRVEALKLQSQEQVASIKRASQEAYEAGVLFRAVVEGASDCVYVKDLHGHYLMVNPAYLRDFGGSKEILIGHTATEVFGAATGETIAKVEREVIETGKSHTVEESIDRIGQTYLSNISPYINQESVCIGIIGISRNITDRKRAESALAELVVQKENARTQAEQAARAKSEFLACMSHEIRTPMNGVLGMSELLLGTELDSEQHEYAQAIHESANALLSVINDILDFSKIEAGKMTLEPVQFNLTEHLRNTIAFMLPNARRKGLAFEAHIDSGLPSAIIADPTKLRQIIVNLLSNAVKFTESGRITLKAETDRHAADAATLRISVEDTGIGVAPDKLERIFETFAQADNSTTRRYGGTGLGLSISQRLAGLMGGEIKVESTLNLGSKFWLEIPVLVPGDGAAAHKVESGGLENAQEQMEKLPLLKILVAEDNKINQSVALHMLKAIGCHADMAQDGVEAVEMALSQSYDMIFMDCEMPRMNGLEATAAILRVKQVNNAPVIIALTAHAFASQQRQCLAAGMKACLTKPIKKDELLDVLMRFAGTTNDAPSVLSKSLS